MRNRMYGLLGAVLVTVMMFDGMASAEENNEPFVIESTAYYEGEITASGRKVREGICAGRKEWLGLTCIVYEDDNGKMGDYIGIYEILDTGSDERIRNGRCIDFYMRSEDDCWEWGRRKVWIQLIDAKG